MYPAGPAWPKLRVLRAMWALLAVLLAPGRLWAKEDIQECIWHVVLIKFEAVGEEGRSDRFFDLEPLETLDSVFSLLVDAPTDQNEKYLGFPYYLKINYSCGGELNIDSCWVGSFYCPQASFTATIYDAIATESTLFIRQNQLVYYFTGTYVTLHESNQGSGAPGKSISLLVVASQDCL